MGPIQVIGADAEAINGAACTYETVDCAEWRPEGSINQQCDTRQAADAFGFSCDYRTWYPTLYCADSAFPPARSTNGAYMHCSDADGNIRKADAWHQGEWEEVFCLPAQIGQWIEISSASRRTRHYLFCHTPDLKYPWPWAADSQKTPYKSCKSDEQAVMGATASDFSCKKSG